MAMSSEQRPQSALNLRLALALFGLVCTGVLAFLAIQHRNLALAVFCCVLASITITDIVVISIRRRRRRIREHGAHHSIFE
jgi:membrane protein YdbS with pleckstrin-like domain